MGFIWSDSFLLLCGGLHRNQLLKYLTAVSEDLINRVKRAWCLNSIPIHRYLQCLSCHRVCQISSGVIWSRAMLPCSCAFCTGSWGPSRNLKKQCKSMCGQLNEALFALTSPNEGICFSYTSTTVYCQRQDSALSGPLIWLHETISIFLLKWQWDLF